MKHNFSRILAAAVVLSAACAWGQTIGSAGNYSIVEALSLKKRPQDSWARSIAFKDRIVAAEPGRAQRLDRRTYLPLELENAGTAWIREDLFPPFEALPAGMEFAFGGTVDQFNRRYYIIVDSAYQIEALPTQEERWIDALANPPAPPAPEQEEGLLAESGDLPVPEEDGGETAVPLAEEDPMDALAQEVAETIPDVPEVPEEDVAAATDAVNDGAEDFDFDALLAGDADGAESDAAAPIPDDEGLVDFAEATETAEEAAAEPEAAAETEPAVGEEVAADAPEAPAEDWEDAFADRQDVALEDVAGEAESADAAAEELADAADALAEDWENAFPETEEPAGEPEASVDAAESAPEEAEEAAVPEMLADGLDAETEPLVVEEEVAAEETGLPEEDFAELVPEPLTSVPEAADSYHVAPMDDAEPITLVPLVSLEPTKAELAAQEERRREAARQEAIRQKEAERQAKIEAKRQREEEARRAKADAAALKKAQAEAREALERERKEAEEARRAEEKRLREEEARALAAMEAREAQEREAIAQAAAREALQKEYDELASRVEAQKADLAERSRMAQEVIAAEVAAREEAERSAREDAERQEELRAGKERLEADLAEVAQQQAEVEARLAAEQAAREEAERLAREESVYAMMSFIPVSPYWFSRRLFRKRTPLLRLRRNV